MTLYFSSVQRNVKIDFPTHLFLLGLETEDGRLSHVRGHKLAEPPSTSGKVQPVLCDVVGETGKTGILPTLLHCLLTLPL